MYSVPRTLVLVVELVHGGGYSAVMVVDEGAPVAGLAVAVVHGMEDLRRSAGGYELISEVEVGRGRRCEEIDVTE